MNSYFQKTGIVLLMFAMVGLAAGCGAKKKAAAPAAAAAVVVGVETPSNISVVTATNAN